jgi:hypothetical protein
LSVYWSARLVTKRPLSRDINVVVVEFVRDGAGNVAELVVLQGTHQERATRAK